MLRTGKSWLWGIALLLQTIALARADETASRLESIPPLHAAALERLSSELGVPLETLEIGDISERALPLTGQTFVMFKVIDRVNGQVHSISLDPIGRRVDANLLKAEEVAARHAQFGVVDSRLAATLALLGDEDTIEVAIWLRAPAPQVPDRAEIYQRIRDSHAQRAERPTAAATQTKLEGESPSGEQPAAERAIDAVADALRREQKDLRRAASASLRAQMPEQQAGVLAALALLNREPTYVSQFAPLVYVVLSKRDVVAIAERSDVDAIYGPNQNRDFLDVAKRLHKADIVDGWNFQGSGIDVGILEDSRIDFTNVWLPAGTTRVPGDGNVDDHATACAGMVASSHATFQGLAQSVGLFSANATTYGDANLAAAIDWAAGTQNLDVINNSWGDGSTTTLNDHDRHYDYVVRYQWSTVTVAAGNDGLGVGNVGSPGKGFNVLTCGGLNDGGTETWADDVMYGSSSTIDPSTGAEKPEVVASAVSITSTVMPASAPGGIADAGSGTSYATPMVTAIVADVMDASNITILPELTKAVMLATALHNIEGSTRLSEQDGTGGVDARAAVQMAEEDFIHDWRSVTPATLPYSIFMQCGAGERVRAVICWDSNPSSDYSSDPLQADIDLSAWGPTGTFVASSTSIANPFEIVDFTATTAGLYEFRVVNFSFTGTSEYIGFAAWSGNKVLVEDVVQTHDTVPPVADNFRFDAESFWNAAAIRTAPADHDLYLYSTSAWADPFVYDWTAVSAYGSSTMDYVLVDCNHAATGDYFLEVRNWSGSAGYTIEHAAHVADITNGTYGPYSMAVGELIEIFDANFAAGTQKKIAVHATSGDANLGLLLHQSNSADPATQMQARPAAVATALGAGVGEVECLTYTATTGDWFGLVVENAGSTTVTDFMIYADTSAPTGSLSINAGAAQTGASRVFLDVTATDAQTGIRRVRVRNVPGTFGAYQALTTPIIWDLAPGAGTRTVEVEIENNACMTAIVSDTISVYACPQPAGPLANGSFSVATGLPWCFTDQSTNGLVQYTGGQALVTGGNDGVSGFTYTYISQAVVVPAGNHTVGFEWSFVSANGPNFDGAFWDLINTATGVSLLGAPATLGAVSGASGILGHSFAGGLTVELRLGTFSTDNIFGAGVSTFDNVTLVLDACDAVTGLTCNGATGNAVLNWTNAESYTEVRITRDAVLIATLAGSATTYTDSAGAAGSHNYSVTGVCAGGVSASSATCTVTIACLPVTSLVCTPTASSVQMSWVLGDIYSQIRILRGGTLIATRPGTATTYTDTTAPAGMNNYQVIGDAPAGVSAPAATCSASVPCDAVTGLACTLVGLNAQLTWALGDTYSLQIRVVRDGALIATLGGTATSYTDVGVPAGPHNYQVIGECGAGLAAPAATCSISAPCDAVAGLVCSLAGSSVQLNWGTGDSYAQILVRRDGATIATLAGGATSYTDSAASAGSHSYEVIGDCTISLAAPAATCVITVPSDPVTGLGCVLVGSSVLMSWGLGDTYTLIRVLRGGSLIATLSGSATSYTDVGAPAGMLNYQVIGEAGPGTASPPASCTVSVPCDPVTGLACSASGLNVTLTWALGDSYAQVHVSRDGIVIATLGPSATSYVDTGVAVGSHMYAVEGDCGAISATSPTCLVSVTSPALDTFVRGDCNVSGTINIADAVTLLNALFTPGSSFGTCLDACDTNNDGLVNIADAVFLLNYLFVPGSPTPPAPFPACGADSGADALGCAAFPMCAP
ncbi:MAG: dockerin type I domain-containing protein [Planctomycetota bacterium]